MVLYRNKQACVESWCAARNWDGSATPGAWHFFSRPYRAPILAPAQHQSLSEKYPCQGGCQVQGQPLFLTPISPHSIPLPHAHHLPWVRVTRAGAQCWGKAGSSPEAALIPLVTDGEGLFKGLPPQGLAWMPLWTPVRF